MRHYPDRPSRGERPDGDADTPLLKHQRGHIRLERRRGIVPAPPLAPVEGVGHRHVADRPSRDALDTRGGKTRDEAVHVIVHEFGVETAPHPDVPVDRPPGVRRDVQRGAETFALRPDDVRRGHGRDELEYGCRAEQLAGVVRVNLLALRQVIDHHRRRRAIHRPLAEQGIDARAKVPRLCRHCRECEQRGQQCLSCHISLDFMPLPALGRGSDGQRYAISPSSRRAVCGGMLYDAARCPSSSGNDLLCLVKLYSDLFAFALCQLDSFAKRHIL